MEKLEEIALSRFRNNEHFQFMTDVDELITTATPLELGIDGIYPPFKAALIAEDATMRTELGSIKSKAIEVLDTLRDKTWKAIFLRVESTLLSPFSPEVDSAHVIKRIIDLYGDLRSMSYNEESAAISNLVNDLILPANVVHTNLVGISMWVNELQMQNEQFKGIFNERNAEFAGRESGDVRAIRIQIDPLYEKLVERINATIVMEIAKPAAIKFVVQLNEKIKYYKTTLASRNGRSKTEEKPVE
jgi:hypothetical protein